MVSDELNNIGMTFNYSGLKGSNLELKYTQILVKETLWKPIQMTLFNKESTIDISTQEINQILDTIIKFFGENGLLLTFPSKISEYENYLKNNNYKNYE